MNNGPTRRPRLRLPRRRCPPASRVAADSEFGGVPQSGLADPGGARRAPGPGSEAACLCVTNPASESA